MSQSRVQSLAIGGRMILAGEAIASGGATASLSVSNLDLTIDGLYWVDVNIKNASGTAKDIACVMSGDSTPTNYYRQFMYADGGVLTPLRQNVNTVYGGLATLNPLMIEGTLRIDRTGFVRFHYTGSASPAASMSISAMTMARTVSGNLTSFAITTNGVFQDGDYVRVYKVATSGGSGGSGDSIAFSMPQTAHGLSVGMSVSFSGSSWVQADRDSATTMCDGLVSAVADANNFTYIQAGKLSLTTGQWDARTGDSGGLTAGEFYWLSATAGGLTKTAPTTGLRQLVGKAISTTVMIIMVGEVVDLGASMGSPVVNLGTATVTSAAATTLTLSGLNLASFKYFYMSVSLDNATASTSNVSLYFNSDTTATNYYSENITANNATLSSGRANNGVAFDMVANEPCVGFAQIINDRDGKPRIMIECTYESAAAIISRSRKNIWNSATNVTSITLSASVASSLAVGSTFTVWGYN